MGLFGRRKEDVAPPPEPEEDPHVVLRRTVAAAVTEFLSGVGTGNTVAIWKDLQRRDINLSISEITTLMREDNGFMAVGKEMADGPDGQVMVKIWEVREKRDIPIYTAQQERQYR